MIFGINTTRDISKLSQISLYEAYNNFEISLVVFMPNITTNHAITYTNTIHLINSEMEDPGWRMVPVPLLIINDIIVTTLLLLNII